MGLSTVEEATAGIIDIINEDMFGVLRLISVQQGFDPRDFALVAFGELFDPKRNGEPRARRTPAVLRSSGARRSGGGSCR